MKKIYFFISILIQLAHAQSPAIEWQKSLGGTSAEVVRKIKKTPDGGYILVASTASNDGDVSGLHGDSDFWVVKLSSTGVIEWQKALGGSRYDYPNDIDLTNDGGYVVVGYTSSNDGDVSGNHNLFYDIWVVKLSGSGELQWQKCFGGTSEDQGYGIKVTLDGGYIFTGYTGSNDGDVTGNHGSLDVWVVKISATGNLEWQKTFGGTLEDRSRTIQLSNDGNYIIAGFTYSNNGDVSGAHGSSDAWIVKISNTGTLLWQKAIGGSSSDEAIDLQPTTDGGFVFVGDSASINGDAIPNPHGDNLDFWIVKLSDNGIIQWQKKLGGSDIDISYSIRTTPEGGYIVVGRSDSNDGDVTTNHGGIDTWAVKLSNTGDIQWEKSLGGSNLDVGMDVTVTSDGGYVIVCWSSSNNGDASGNHGGYDAWIVKLNADPLSTGDSVKKELKVFPNPATSMITIQNSEDLTFDTITILDLTGKKVLALKVTGNQIDITNLQAGTYVLEALSGNQKFSTKFIKQ